jgi:hypothetical protein
MPNEYEQLLRRTNQTPSPGGMDLNALLSRGIQGTIAGAQEETGIKRKVVASDLLSQQLAQAAQELQNRMQGYEFEQTKGFDQSLLNDPRVGATLSDAFKQTGFNPLTSPNSRAMLGAFHKFQPGVKSHQDNAAEILKNWQVVNWSGDRPEPDEVKWARNVLGIGAGTTTGTDTNDAMEKRLKELERRAGVTGTVSEHVPYGFGRAAAGGAVGGVGFYGGSKAFEAGAAKFAPKMGAGKLTAGKFGSGLVGSGIAELILSQIDPRNFEAQREYPKTALAAGAIGIGGASKAKQAFEKIPFLARFTRRGAQLQHAAQMEEAAAKAAQRGSNLGPEYKGSFGGGQPPPQQSPPTGAAPKQPYKPNVKGYEEFLKKQFGER